MDLNRTKRTLLNNQTTEDYQHASQLLDALDIVQEDAQESFEDQMRFHQQIPNKADVKNFLERSVESLMRMLMEVSDMETLLTLLVKEDATNFTETLSKIGKQLDEERADRERWALIGEDLGSLDDHPF